MKKQNIIRITNWILLFSIPLMLLSTKVDSDIISSNFSIKNLATNFIAPVKNQNSTTIEETSEIEKEQDEITKDNALEKEKIEESKEIEEVQPIIQEEVQTQQVSTSDVIAAYSGNMSFYRANCNKCTGITSTGFDVSDGKLYYYDSNYGNLRIVAGGSELADYSIVRIKNSSFGEDILAIKLDCGGDIGLGRRFLIDLLTNSSEAKGGVDYNITVEVLRNGR